MYDKTHKYNVKITLRDRNAKAGKEETFRPKTGPNSKREESNDDGNKIANFTFSKNLTISSTYFPHKTFINRLGNPQIERHLTKLTMC